MAALRIKNGQVIGQVNCVRMFKDGNIQALATRGQVNREAVPAVTKRLALRRSFKTAA